MRVDAHGLDFAILLSFCTLEELKCNEYPH
jgi:hypothetical protein